MIPSIIILLFLKEKLSIFAWSLIFVDKLPWIIKHFIYIYLSKFSYKRCYLLWKYSNLNLRILSLSAEKKTLSTALGYEPRSFETQSKASFLLQQDYKFLNLNLNLICIYLRYKSLKLSTRTPDGNVSYLIRD